ncbi:MAG TPA: alpha/beta fold hydrolase [Alphaproteobacteria bacterium]|nr:alpha/beta fold hydrolase [Alphaproteobacteria bacterium]
MAVLICVLMAIGIMTATGPKNASAAQTRDTVVMLHGIGHSRWNMYWVERAMRKEGYATVNITYPSLKQDISALAGFIHERLAEEKIWTRAGRVHFVTHSMGGLVARRYLAEHKSDIPLEKMGRVVMIAPPNGGSEVADFLKNFPPYRWGFGPAGQQLTTKARSADVATPWYETGIIAGTRGWPYIVAGLLIDGDHDGRVCVEKTKLKGMKDHITFAATHSFISWKRGVHGQITHFLKDGVFDHDKP